MKTTVIFIHGWGLNKAVWEAIIAPLSIPYKALNLPGHGDSPLADNTIQAWIQALIKDIPDNAILIGWSLGGLMALNIAHYYPQKVKAIGLIASNPCFVKNNNWPGMDKATLEKFSVSLLEDMEKTWQKFLNLQFLQQKNAKQLIKALKEKVVSQGLAHKPALQQGLTFLGQDWRYCLANIHIPIYLLLGGKDKLVPVEIANNMQDFYKNIKVQIIEEAGHGLLLTHADQVIKMVNELYAI